MQEMWVWSLGQEDPLEEGMTAHSSILAWRIPWTEDPGGLQSLGLQKSQTWLSDWIRILIHMGRCTCFWNLEWGCISLLAMLWGGRAQSASEMSIKDHHSLHCGPWVGRACLCSQSGLWWSPSVLLPCTFPVASCFTPGCATCIWVLGLHVATHVESQLLWAYLFLVHLFFPLLFLCLPFTCFFPIAGPSTGQGHPKVAWYSHL